MQFTLRRMGAAVVESRLEIERIHLSLPNRHHLLFALTPFGLANDNEIFTPTTEPYGLVEGTVERGTPAGPAPRDVESARRPLGC